jgi:cell division septal protein FtsQ
LALEAILLYCVYRGYSWARWITGILLALGVILGLQEIAPFLPGSPGAVFELRGIRQTIVALGSIVLPLMMIVGFAIGAVIMLASSSVRIFQQAQQNRPSIVSEKREQAKRILRPVIIILFALLAGFLIALILLSYTMSPSIPSQ